MEQFARPRKCSTWNNFAPKPSPGQRSPDSTWNNFARKPSPGRLVLFHVEQFLREAVAWTASRCSTWNNFRTLTLRGSHCLNGLVLGPALVPGSKDIVELLLLRADFFLLVEIFLLDPHLGQHFAAFVRILVALALRIAAALVPPATPQASLASLPRPRSIVLEFRALDEAWYQLLQLFLARCGPPSPFSSESCSMRRCTRAISSSTLCSASSSRRSMLSRTRRTEAKK